MVFPWFSQQPFVTQQVELVLHVPRSTGSTAWQGIHEAPLGVGSPAAGALLIAVGGPPPTAFLFWSMKSSKPSKNLEKIMENIIESGFQKIYIGDRFVKKCEENQL